MKTVTYNGVECELIWAKDSLVGIKADGVVQIKHKDLVSFEKVQKTPQQIVLEKKIRNRQYNAKRKAARKI